MTEQLQRLDADLDDCPTVYTDDPDDGFDIDDMGNAFERCDVADNGHLFLTACGTTRCVHCQKVVAV